MVNHHSTRILIAEDEYLASVQLRDNLENIGYVVVAEASNGEEAVSMTTLLHPDIVIMDIKMAPIDGLEAARRIRKTCPTPVVMLTAHQTPDLLAQANAAGVSAYLTKPSSVRELERTLEIARSRFSEMAVLREEKHALLQEILHRTRNNMQVMLSLIELQSNTIDDAATLDLLRNFRDRIRSMALVHDRIYQTDVTTVNLAEYLNDITRTLWNTYAVSLQRVACYLDAEPFPLSIDAAVPFGLLSYELIANALKHAFPEDAGGEVRLRLRAIDDGYFEFRVIDTGCGFAEAHAKRQPPGLGLKLANIIVKHQFFGTLDILHHDPGTEIIVRLKPPQYTSRIPQAQQSGTA